MYTYHDHMCIVYMRNFMTICIQSIYIYTHGGQSFWLAIW